MTPSRGAWAAFAAPCVLILAWTVVMSALEPVMLDGWFIASFDGSALDFIRANRSGELFWGNARLGQMIAVVTYGSAHLIVTPLCVLALFVLLLVHLRGRWPVPSDAWALVVLLGVTVLAQPQLGPLLFYRPFTANYVVGLVVQLIWMVPYRFALAREPALRPLAGELAVAIGMFVLGVAAGACNEHTGPALAVAGVIVAIRFARKRQLRIWMVAGLVGLVAGYLALMLAPAQATRYCGVASELSVGERLVDRGLIGNLSIVVGLVWAGRWAWLALAIAAAALRRRIHRRREAMIWIALGVAISLTLLASPKQGNRLLFAALAFATIGIVVILEDLAGDRRRARIAIAGIAGAVLATAVVWSVIVQLRVSSDYDERMHVLAAQTPGAVVRVPMLREGPSRWFVGDDLTSDSHRHYLANLLRLEAIELEGNPTIPYQFEIRYQLTHAPRTSTRRFQPVQPLCETRHDFVRELASLQSAHGSRLVAAELAVMPRVPIAGLRELAASRWRTGQITAPSASVVNERYDRWISVDRGGLAGALDVSVVGPERVERLVRTGDRWSYRPWGRGTYWIVVCAGDDCYLAESHHHL